MIEVSQLTKRYGDVLAVDDLSFAVEPGTVTGFLGPNGAGKSTTMRMILGLDRPTSGDATLGGRRYRDLKAPSSVVGACLNPRAMQDGRTAAAHLRWVAAAAGADGAGIRPLLEKVGIARAADRRIGALSLGMRQRLGIAAALINDPQVLILDEPLNGLDPEGIVWVRTLLRELAERGRTVFVSSHLMNEMQETADHVVVIAGGKLRANLGIDELTARAAGMVRVAAERPETLADALRRAGAEVQAAGGTVLTVRGLDAAVIGQIAFQQGISLSELTPERAGLEAAFMELTAEGVSA